MEKTQDKQESRVSHKIQEKYYRNFIVKWFRERCWCKKSDAQEKQVEGVQQREMKSLLITAQSNVIQNTTSRKSQNNLKLILGGKYFANNITESEVRTDSDE